VEVVRRSLHPGVIRVAGVVHVAVVDQAPIRIGKKFVEDRLQGKNTGHRVHKRLKLQRRQEHTRTGNCFESGFGSLRGLPWIYLATHLDEVGA